MRTTKGQHKLNKRMSKAMPRLARVMRISRASTATAEGVYKQGFLPSVGFGTQVWGIPPASLARLRSWYSAFAAGGGKGKSHKKVLLLKGDPTWAIATAPLLNFFDLLWAAGMGAPNMPNLTTLSSWWRSTAEPPARWSSIRGPVGATRFVLRHFGLEDGRRLNTPSVLVPREHLHEHHGAWAEDAQEQGEAGLA